MLISPIFRQFQIVISYITDDLTLFVRKPAEYLYLFNLSKDKPINIYPYNPATKKLGEQLIAVLKREVPDLTVQFVGSAVLNLPGQNDVDLIAKAPAGKLLYYQDKITQILGEPSQQTAEYVEWTKLWQSCNVDFLLAYPQNKLYQDMVKTHEILQSNKEVFKKYKDLKINSHKISEREYQKRRLRFFTKYVG